MKYTEDVPSALEELRESGYQLTPQRREVIERCFSMEGHFTAEDLQSFNGEDDTGFSRATVYNTLNVLVDVGFLRELHDMADSSYYEVTGSSHPHAHCTSCGALIDVPVNLEREVDNWDVPFEVEDVRMTLEGLCESCKSS